jgi:hypothetical protein
MLPKEHLFADEERHLLQRDLSDRAGDCDS